MKTYYLLILCFALLALVACSENLFGSSGSGNCDKDVKCLQTDAENAFRNHDYKKAYNIYSQIVGIDSTVSAGYFGMAKAGLWMNGVNPFEVFAHVKRKEGEIAFMDLCPSEQNRYFQGMKRAGPMLRELERRDSLTALYEFHRRNIDYGFDTTFTVMEEDGTVAEVISLEKRLKNFRATHCSTSECPGFPLSDRVLRYNAYSGGLLISTISEKILNTMDTNKDGCIAKRPDVKKCNSDPAYKCCGDYDFGPGEPTQLQAWANWGCAKNSNGNYSYDLSINLALNESGGFEIDINQLLEDMQLDDFYEKQRNDPKIELPDDIKDFNKKMDEFNESMDEIMSVMGKFKDKNNGDEVPFGWENDIGEYKDYSTFYKVGTNIDEDGDGCIGEDIMDGQDNDGDGLKNSNSRLASLNNPHYADDGLMGFHGMTGNPDDDMPIRININDSDFGRIANNPERTIFADLNPDEDGFVNVIKFTQKPGYWTSNNRDDKLRVAQDTACPPKISLEERKTLIGGCWPNYTEEKFVKYWLKRELARLVDQEKRVHDTCKKCKTTAECLGR
jgi:hypothetical protein